MKKELEKQYDHQKVEDRIYSNWLEKGYFHAEVDEAKTPYTIVIPPPNITSQLHMGHGFECTLIDILIRTKRMQGYNALWMPGTDHASIATETKIVEKMADENLTKKQIGRDEFLKRAWKWREDYGGTIISQLKKLGASCDWERERFTMDEGLSDAVLEVFVMLYEKGLIYRGEKLINWCPHCRTTISDAEVDHKDKEGALWHLKYPVNGTEGFLQFATTRPETMLGDTAVAVNPNDPRYAGLVGKTVTVPIVGRVIPIVADDYVDMEYGTGAVKVTPAHDPNDFLIGERHGLPVINIMNDDGTLNENAGKYSGMPASEARLKIVEEFDSIGLFVKKEKITHAVGVHERCNKVIEPRIKLQWFVKMEGLAKPAIDVYKSGELRIFPERFGKVYLNWLENIRDWCISRQLWWGHRIPAYYCADCGGITVSKTMPEKCEKCGCGSLTQDEDVLDTWFSSALWPFSTLGWPNNTTELRYFYPTNVLCCGADILFFWVVRMVFSGIEFTGQKPFKDVLFHGIVRDEQGRKMSKSLGNGIDPLGVIENHGADALRFTLVTGNAPGADFRFNAEKLGGYRNFLNKIWNAARFILLNMDVEIDVEAEKLARQNLTDADKWIISGVNGLARSVTEHIDAYDINLAAMKIYDFIWDEFCDWYIEMVKPRLYNNADKTRGAAIYTLKTVFCDALKLLHPFMPFITEEIFVNMQSSEETIMLSKWPEFSRENDFPDEERAVGIVKEAVKAVRSLRAEMNVPTSKKAALYIVSDSAEIRGIFEAGKSILLSTAYATGAEILESREDVPKNAVSAVAPGAEIFIPLEDLVDTAKERERLLKEKERLENEVVRVVSKLNNKGFTDKAPTAVVDEERQKESVYREMLEKVCGQLESL